MDIRHGVPGDLAAIVDIYNHYIVSSHVTFDTSPYEVTDRTAWFESFSVSGPSQLLVAEGTGGVAGYAYSAPIRPKPAYSRSVEVTAYVDPERTAEGVGTALYRDLLPRLADAGVHRCYAVIALPNPASIALHEAFGFTVAGTFHEVGFKFGRYWDTAWYERRM